MTVVFPSPPSWLPGPMWPLGGAPRALAKPRRKKKKVQAIPTGWGENVEWGEGGTCQSNTHEIHDYKTVTLGGQASFD